MKKFIEVYDDIIDDKLADVIEDNVITKSWLPFNYMGNVTYEKSHSNYFFKPGIGHSFINPPQINYTTFSFFSNILYKFCCSQNIIVENCSIGRVFMDLPTPNPKTDYPPHIDTDTPHWVCLYYVNNSDGDTVFYKDDKITEIRRVSPKKGRIAFFDGSIYHASTPSETKSRAVINFNFTPYL